MRRQGIGNEQIGEASPALRTVGWCSARWACRIAAYALFVSLVATLGRSSAVQAQDCTDCHSDIEIPAEPHGDFACTDCHDGVEVPPHPDDVDGKHPIQEPCGDCHDVADTLAESVHEGAACGDCHGPAHAIGPVNASSSAVSVKGQIRSCGGCHEDEVVESYKKGVHGRALLAAGLPVAASCGSCHGSHEILPSDEPGSWTSDRSSSAPGSGTATPAPGRRPRDRAVAR